MNKDFEVFKREFIKYQKLFGLTGYKVYFQYCDLDSSFANITVSQLNMVATVRLDKKSHKERNVKRSAKHEALHLLIYRLEDAGIQRFGTQEDITMASEEIVSKLEDLIE